MAGEDLPDRPKVSERLRDIPLELEYETGDNLVSEFYVPCLSAATKYDRAAGYFSSASLSLAARGIEQFIRNGGSMRLICSYEFDERDLEVLRAAGTRARETEVIETALLDELSSQTFPSQIAEDRFRCLAWMLDQAHLDIRIAYMPEAGSGDASIYHEKVGVFEDSNEERVAFSGSINETAQGWQGNFESFDVFRSWVTAEEPRVKSKEDRFARLWNDRHQHVVVRDLPEAVKIGLRSRSPGTKNGLPDLPVFQDPDFEYPESQASSGNGSEEISLWKHQRKAIQWWEEHDYSGILAMATGTGKTFAALSGAKMGGDTRLTVIVVPKKVLLDQWREEVRKVFGNDTVVLECSGRTDWKSEISMIVDPYRVASDQNLRSKDPAILLTTPHTGGTDAFLMALKGVKPHRLQLIADEVHNYGAPTFRQIFEIDAGRRMGLSATPVRKWDEEGTDVIFEYFGGHDPFEFSTVDAIENGYLVDSAAAHIPR